jgi:hypothetical protein
MDSKPVSRSARTKLCEITDNDSLIRFMTVAAAAAAILFLITGQAIRNLERETGHLASVIIAITALADPISQKRGREEYV